MTKWVGAERGTLRPVSPRLPLQPHLRLSPHTATARRFKFHCISPTSTGTFPRVNIRIVCVRNASTLRPFPLYATFSRSLVGRHPHKYYGRPATFHSPGFAPYSALHPQHSVGRFPFRALFRLGHRRIRPGVVPQTTRRSPCHPVEGFPCSLVLDSAT